MTLAFSTNAQVLLNEQFTGGASTTGFTIVSDDTDCDWTFAPGDVTAGAFNMDFGGAMPTGAGFDGDFAFLDSDECGLSGITVNSTLVSPAFNAGTAQSLTLSFSHQFRARLQSFGKVEVFNGATWTEVALYTTTDVGYPNPAMMAVIDITAAAGGAANAQVRFQFSAGWDWWWALDNITVTAASCSFPAGLAMSNVGTNSATVNFTPNGSAGYEWVVTNGALPGTGGDVANGTTSGQVVADLEPATVYSIFVRSLCNGGGFSPWSPNVTFTTTVANDECSTAVPLTVNADLACGVVTPGATFGATASPQPDVDSGTPNDDVWFSFVATSTGHQVSLLDVSNGTDMGHSVYRGLPDPCAEAGMTLVVTNDPNVSVITGLTVGETYFVRVYSWSSTPVAATFNICVGTLPPPPANDECTNAVALTVNADLACGVVTPGSTYSGTPSVQPDVDSGTPNDDVWYSFVATSTAHRVSLLNISNTTDMGHSTYRALPDPCAVGGMTLVLTSDPNESNPTGLTVGETYFVRVYSWSSTPVGATFDICIGTPPGVGMMEITAEDSFVLYPNPTQGLLTLEVTDQFAQLIRVLDNAGRVVMDVPFTRMLDVHSLDAGNYTVLVIDRDSRIIGGSRFVRE